MPAGLIGTWKVSGRTIEVTADTNILQNKGESEGAMVHVVTAPPAAEGEIPHATLIQVLANSKSFKDQDKGKPEFKGKPEDKGKSEDKSKPDMPGKPVDKAEHGKSQHR